MWVYLHKSEKSERVKGDIRKMFGRSVMLRTEISENVKGRGQGRTIQTGHRGVGL